MPDEDVGQNSVLHLDIDGDAFKHFARWLYTGSIVNRMHQESDMYWFDEMECLLQAYAFASQHRCGEVMDLAMDEVIELLSEEGIIFVGDFVDASVKYCQPGSTGRQLAVDFLVYGKAASKIDAECKAFGFGALKFCNDPDFSKALARTFLAVKGFETPAEIEIAGFSTVLAGGFLEAKEHEAEEEEDLRAPWKVDPCKYHSHTELGLPCYKAKE